MAAEGAAEAFEPVVAKPAPFAQELETGKTYVRLFFLGAHLYRLGLTRYRLSWVPSLLPFSSPFSSLFFSSLVLLRMRVIKEPAFLRWVSNAWNFGTGWIERRRSPAAVSEVFASGL